MSSSLIGAGSCMSLLRHACGSVRTEITSARDDQQQPESRVLLLDDCSARGRR